MVVAFVGFVGGWTQAILGPDSLFIALFRFKVGVIAGVLVSGFAGLVLRLTHLIWGTRRFPR